MIRRIRYTKPTIATSIAGCIFLYLGWRFAPEVWEGYSREFWALLAAGGLTAIAGFITETGRRNFSE